MLRHQQTASVISTKNIATYIKIEHLQWAELELTLVLVCLDYK